MKTTKTYFTGCNFCNATGLIKDINNFGMGTTELMKTCPVCNGTKIIMVTETMDDEDNIYKDK